MLYISYLVPAARIRGLVPEILPLSIVRGDKAFVSIVLLNSSQARLNWLPYPSFDYNQINIRTYIKDPQSNNQAVYFLRSGVTSKFISLATRAIGVPWERISCEFKIDADKESNYKSYKALGHWSGDFSISAASKPGTPVKPAPFADLKSATDYLIRPLLGFYGRNEKVSRFRIQHPDIEPSVGQLQAFDFPVFKDMELVDKPESCSPHSVFIVPRAQFRIYLPASRLDSRLSK
ncbi:DUF2071 domain-containing protein [Chloroflexota bacterium]